MLHRKGVIGPVQLIWQKSYIAWYTYHCCLCYSQMLVSTAGWVGSKLKIHIFACFNFFRLLLAARRGYNGAVGLIGTRELRYEMTGCIVTPASSKRARHCRHESC